LYFAQGKNTFLWKQQQKPWTIYWIHFDGENASFFAEGFDKSLLVLQKKTPGLKTGLSGLKIFFRP
jgi:hypothetical protein